MEVYFVVVPPNGGECDYQFVADLPAIPREGDWIQVVDPKNQAANNRCDFIVGRVRWDLRGTIGEMDSDERTAYIGVSVEARYAKSPNSSDRHAESHDDEVARTGVSNEITETMF